MKQAPTVDNVTRRPSKRRRPWAMIIVLAWLAVSPQALGAQAVGPEFQVNTYTTSYQYIPAVAADPSGGFVVVWTSDGSSGSDTSAYSVLGQRFDSNGAPLNAEFQVNTYTTLDQSQPAVALDGSGGFVVSWLSSGSSGTDTSGISIQGQRFDSNGAPAGGEFQVNTYTTSGQYTPAAAELASGGFVIAWTSDGSSGTDSSLSSIHGQLFDSDGLPDGTEFQANTYTMNRQRNVAVGRDGSGGFVVAWESAGSSFTDSSGYSILGQRFGADGLPDGPEFQANTYTTLDQRRPAVSADGSGGFVVAWQSDGSNGTDSSGLSVQGQRFGSDGLPVGDEFQVNTYTTASQSNPAMSSDAIGGFVVAWSSSGSSGTDSDGLSVQGRRFGSDGSPIGVDFQVNTVTTSGQRRPAASEDGSGGFVVVWDSNASSGTDPDLSVQGQRFNLEIFKDGFESGNTSAWSVTVP